MHTEPKAVMKNILLEISKGNFKSVLKRILENDVNLNSNNALKVIVSCCTVCTKQECPIDDETLSKLLIICAKQITDMSEASCLNNYLQAICFITKYLLEKVSEVYKLFVRRNILLLFIFPELFHDN